MIDAGAAGRASRCRPAIRSALRALHAGRQRPRPRGIPAPLPGDDRAAADRRMPSSASRTRWWQDAAADNLRYLEVRYCPALSTRDGLTLDDVDSRPSGAAWSGASATSASGPGSSTARSATWPRRARSRSPSIRCGCGRHGVVAFDLAGGEAGRMPGVHGEAFDIAARGGLGITVHAGEAAGPESVAEAIHRCHAERIGHGTRLGEDPATRGVRARPPDRQSRSTSPATCRPTRSERAAEHPVRALPRSRPQRDALHRQLAHVRRDAHRRVLAGPHRARRAAERRSTA